MVDTINSNIECFTSGRNAMTIEIDGNSEAGLRELWRRGNVEGDLNAALGELAIKHNASQG